MTGAQFREQVITRLTRLETKLDAVTKHNADRFKAVDKRIDRIGGISLALLTTAISAAMAYVGLQ